MNYVEDVYSFSVSARTITFKKKYNISDFASILNITRGKFVYLPVDQKYTGTITNGIFSIPSSVDMTGWAPTDKLVVKIFVSDQIDPSINIVENEWMRLEKEGKHAYNINFGYFISPVLATTPLFTPRAQKLFTLEYIHISATTDIMFIVKYAKSSTNNLADYDPYIVVAGASEEWLDTGVRKAGTPYQYYGKGDVRIQGNSGNADYGDSGMGGYLKIQIQSLSGNGKVYTSIKGFETSVELS